MISRNLRNLIIPSEPLSWLGNIRFVEMLGYGSVGYLTILPLAER